MKTKTVLYVDMWKGEWIQELKLSGINRYAHKLAWRIIPISEEMSRPKSLAGVLSRLNPAGCIVECSAAHDDLPPSLFGKIPAVYLDCQPSLYGSKATKIILDNAATVRLAFHELSVNLPSAYAVVGYRNRRPWSTTREKIFRTIAEESGKPCAVFRRRTESDEARAWRLAQWVAALPAKTAIFAANDVTASEVVAACRRCGRKIPSEITLTGVDNIEAVCETATTKLSSIQVDFELAGYRAAKALDELMVRGRRKKTGPELFGPMMPVRRESTLGYGRRYEPRILQVVEKIRREALHGLTARDAMAGITGSRRLFEMRFREAMGHGVLDEILHVRLEHVCRLLAETDTPIGAIADFCGFNDNSTLAKLFRRRFGCSLLAWRKANRRKP